MQHRARGADLGFAFPTVEDRAVSVDDQAVGLVGCPSPQERDSGVDTHVGAARPPGSNQHTIAIDRRSYRHHVRWPVRTDSCQVCTLAELGNSSVQLLE